MPRIEMSVEGKRVHLNSGQHLALATGHWHALEKALLRRREIRPIEEDQDVRSQQQA